MRRFIWLFALVFVVTLLGTNPVAAATCTTANCPGQTCQNLGTTLMSDDKANLIACVLTTGTSAASPTCANNGGCMWKPMTPVFGDSNNDVGIGTATPGANLDVAGVARVSSSIAVPSSWGTADQVNINGNQIWNSGGWLFLNYSAPANSFVQIGGAGNTQNLSVPNGSICLNGNCISNWSTANAMYQCPDVSPASIGGGAWGFWGCTGQIASTSQCRTIAFPPDKMFDCTYIGHLMLAP